MLLLFYTIFGAVFLLEFLVASPGDMCVYDSINDHCVAFDVHKMCMQRVYLCRIHAVNDDLTFSCGYMFDCNADTNTECSRPM